MKKLTQIVISALAIISLTLFSPGVLGAAKKSSRETSPAAQKAQGATAKNAEQNQDAPRVPEPCLVLDSFSTKPKKIVAGKPFTLSLTLTNATAPTARNIKLSLSDESGDLFFQPGETGTRFLSSMGGKRSVTLTFNLDASQNAQSQPRKLKLHLDYDGAADAGILDAEVVLKVLPAIRLEYDEPALPAEVNAGETITIPLSVMNLGVGTVYNVRMSLDVDGLTQRKTAFLGNIEGGTEASSELYAFVAGKGEGAGNATSTTSTSDDTTLDYGLTEGTIVVDYEDAYGNTYSKEFSISTTILPPLIDEKPTAADDAKPGTTHWAWIVAVSLLGLVLVGVLLGYAWKRLQHKRADKTPDANN